MSSYVRSIRHEVPFDGETVVVSLKPLLFGDMLRLRSAMDDSQDEYLKLAGELLPGYVEKMEGPTDAAHTQVPLDELCRVAFFTPVVFSCMTRLLTEARLKDPSRPGNASTATLPVEAPSLETRSAA